MSRRRILVADDEPGMLRAVRRVLDRSYEVACVASPEEALSAVDSFEPDLAILDVRMPRMDGFELMGRLKEVRPDVDVILMTGSVTEADQKLVRSIREKAFYFIQKPFDREVLQTLVERCLELRRLAEENRRHVTRLENVLAEARAFQSSLLPESERRIDDVTIVGRHVPCESLCGDFYDYAPCGPGRLAFLIADVSGHGAAAAMLTGIVKSAFRSCHAEGFRPEAVVERIAAGIRTFRANRFVTLICGTVDVKEETLIYVNAGHPSGMVWNGSSEISLLEPTGPIVSPVLDTAVWETGRRAFSAADRILLYTDGIIEARGEGEFFGVDRVHEAIEGAPTGGAGLVESLLDAVRGHMRGRPPDDDMTVLTLSRG
jgi:sigma-B regulation protein RsbU (phosphoserine phosphatase)